MISPEKCNTTMTFLRGIPPPPRPAKAGRFWRGVRHADLIDGLAFRLAAVGTLLDLKAARLWISEDAADLRASIPLTGSLATGVFKPHLGVSASNARRGVLTFYCGALDADGVPVVVDRLSGNKTYQWMYTHQFDPGFVAGELAHWFSRAVTKALPDTVATLSTWVPTADEAAAALFRVGRKKVVPFSRVGRADSSFRKGRDKSGLGLLRAVAAHIPRESVLHQMSDYLHACHELVYERELHYTTKGKVSA